MIKYVSNAEINTEKWNSLVERSQNGNIFCYSWYLSNFCSWDAIILNDYEGAIALPFKLKWGLRFLYQPTFVQKCDWFGASLSPELESTIWQILTKRFSSIHFNTNLELTAYSKSRVNLILTLHAYDTLYASYSKSLRKNLSKAKSFGLRCVHSHKHINTTIALYKQVYGPLNPSISDFKYNNLSNFLKSASMQDHLEIVCVLSEDEVLASMLFLKKNKRLHYILGAPTQKGRELNALSLGIDFVINKYSNQEYYLDFEGSSIPNVKKFYESFGAKDEGFVEIEYYPNYPLRIAKSFYKRLRRS